MENKEEKTNIQKRLETDFFAEKRLLRALYNNPEYFEDERVDIDLLSSMSTKNVFTALQNLVNKGITPTRDALLQEYSVIDLDASPYVVDVISDESVKNEDLTDIISQLKDFRKRREAVASLKSAIKTIENTARVTNEQYEKIDEDIVNATSQLNPKGDEHDIDDVMTFEQWFNSYKPEFAKRQNGKVYWFRNYMFDSLVEDGPQPGEIGIIASASGSGKSTVCANLVNGFIETHIPTAYYSLEMSQVATMDRILAKRCHIPYKKIKNPGDDYDEILAEIEAQRKELKDNPLFRFCDSGDVSLKKLEKDIKRFQKETNTRYWIVVVDLLSMVSDFTKFTAGANFAQGIEVAVNKLSALAKRLGVHFIGVLQLNRNAEAQGGINSIDDLDKLKPNRAQIKNANAFLERARYVVTTFRKLPYAKLFLKEEEYEGQLDDIIEVSIVKLNNGEIGESMYGIFDAEYFDILPMEKEETEAEIQDKAFANVS